MARDLVDRRVRSTLPIAQHGDPLSGLLAALAPLSPWLVLDNAEHLLAGVVRW